MLPSATGGWPVDLSKHAYSEETKLDLLLVERITKLGFECNVKTYQLLVLDFILKKKFDS